MDDFMQIAIEEAKKGLEEGGIPIGAVLTKDNRLLSKGHNMRVQEKNPIMHAEMTCIRNAGLIKNYAGAILYSTLMPCFMCAGAIVEFKIPTVITGESKTYKGAKKFLQRNEVKVIDLNLHECRQLMESFIEKNSLLWKEDIGEL